MKTKKIISLVGAFLLACSACPLTVSAKGEIVINQNVTVDGLIYSPCYSNATTTEIISYDLVDVENTTIESVTIPTEINGLPVSIVWGENPFRECQYLTEILVEDDNADYDSIDGVLFSENATQLISYPCAKNDSEYVIPESVIWVGSYAFSNCTKLESVTVLDSLQLVYDYGFYQCENLKTIIGSLPISAGRAFSTCKNLQSIAIKSGSDENAIHNISLKNFLYLEEFKIEDNATVGNIVINNCPLLTKLTTFDNEKTSNANDSNSELIIVDCSNLKEISTGNTRKTIRISNCSSLEKIEIADYSTKHDDSDFIGIQAENCPALQSILFYHQATTLMESPLSHFSDCGDFTVYGFADNEILAWTCEKNNIPFLTLASETSATKGDATGDGEVDITDIIVANKAILGQKTLTAEQVKALDIDGNNIVDTTDSLAIMKYIVGLIESL